MIYGFFGDLGSGKTLTMTRYAYAYYLSGYEIYSNYWLAFPHTLINKEFLQEAVKKNEDIQGDKILFVLDEFDMYIDSRTSMSKSNLVISYFIKQIRKKNIKLMYATQLEDSVDKRLRNLTRSEIICQATDIILHDVDRNEIKIKIIFNEIFVLGKLKQKSRFIANKYFDMYDTKQLITE